MSKTKQLNFEFRTWGGARKGAGRKPNGKRPGVSRLTRPKLASRHPVFVTQRIQGGLPNLRWKGNYAAVRDCIAAHNARWNEWGFRITDYVVIGNHLHLIVEAINKPTLSRGLQGLFIRIAKTLNRRWKRRGSIVVDRYDAKILKSPREVRNRLAYLYCNARKHRLAFASNMSDPCSSGPWFDGWKHAPANAQWNDDVTVAPHTWLRAKGWRRHGLLRTDHVPG